MSRSLAGRSDSSGFGWKRDTRGDGGEGTWRRAAACVHPRRLVCPSSAPEGRADFGHPFAPREFWRPRASVLAPHGIQVLRPRRNRHALQTQAAAGDTEGINQYVGRRPPPRETQPSIATAFCGLPRAAMSKGR
jgi:hypothetical protein